MSAETGKGWKLTLRIVGATVAVLSCPVGFSVFALLFHNWYAGIANLIVGVVGAFNLHLHMSFKHDRLHQNYSERSLKIIKRSSLCLGSLALLVALTFLILAGVLKRFIHPIGTSMVLPGIQSFVVFQECAMHYYYRRKYLRLAAESDRSQLTESVEEEYPAVENDSEASNGVPEIAT